MTSTATSEALGVGYFLSTLQNQILPPTPQSSIFEVFRSFFNVGKTEASPEPHSSRGSGSGGCCDFKSGRSSSSRWRRRRGGRKRRSSSSRSRCCCRRGGDVVRTSIAAVAKLLFLAHAFVVYQWLFMSDASSIHMNCATNILKHTFFGSHYGAWHCVLFMV